MAATLQFLPLLCVCAACFAACTSVDTINDGASDVAVAQDAVDAANPSDSGADAVSDTSSDAVDAPDDATDAEDDVVLIDADDVAETPDVVADTRAEDAAPDTAAVDDVAPDASADVAEDTAPDVPDDTGADVTADSGTAVDIRYPDQRIGIFYLTWHTYASTAIRSLPEADRLTMEEVIRDPELGFFDMLGRHGLLEAAASFHYQAEPEPGFYCMYRARPGDESPGAPDCPNIAETARRHAEQIWDASIDFVYTDLTNLPVSNGFADVLGLRPTEVLFEEWAALRASGTPTPQIAVWVPASPVEAGQRPLFRDVLELYANPAYADLVFQDEDTGRPVLFVVANPALRATAEHLAEIEAAGVTPVELWGNLSPALLDSGIAGWMQPCTDGGTFTTLISTDARCNQSFAATTPIGEVVSVSASYQLGYASMPFQASGRNGGMTLKKQFETAYAQQPDYLLINAWNEHIAQPQPNPYAASLGAARTSMGVGEVAADSFEASLWVDGYGDHLSRDIEPPVEGGDEAYELLQSCIRVYRGGVAGCGLVESADEACCDFSGGSRLVYSLRRTDGGNYDTAHLLTLSRPERDGLVAGPDWTDVCNPGFAPPGLCDGGTTLDGPFLTFAEAGPGRTELFRCFTGVTHFFSLDAGCEGTTSEGGLGYVAAERSSAAPRSLRRCYRDGAGHFHVLDGVCLAPARDEGIVGYVR